MALDKQVYIYSVDTNAFHTKHEEDIREKLLKARKVAKEVDKKSDRLKQLIKSTFQLKPDLHPDVLLLNAMCMISIDKINLYDRQKKRINSIINEIKEPLLNEFKDNQHIIRELDEKELKIKNQVSSFESVLTRTLGMKHNELSTDIIIVQSYYKEILKSLITNGFMLRGVKYIAFTASAGQIRTKKTVFMKESLWNKNKLALMCGLTVDKINSKGGMSINKYLAYLALCNSATEVWEDFDIDKTIVVDDFETEIETEVDFIDDNTYEIERKKMKIPINHTDGCGMILPKASKKAFMTRLPWVKGLLVPFNFRTYINEEKKKLDDKSLRLQLSKVKDIYGQEHDLIKEDIEVVFTKSQFKMWKYYDSWEQYKEFYKLHNCQAGKTNIEEDTIRDGYLNYQMLQTLTDITPAELQEIVQPTVKWIESCSSDTDMMFKLMGVTHSNKKKNALQQALSIAPELLLDPYTKQKVKETKKSFLHNAYGGKLKISGKYTYVSPDLYAFCEHLIKKDSNPKGLLGYGEVSCALFETGEKVDCLRSPHLYREHAVRVVENNENTKKWLKSNCIYTSIHDPISKILMFDCDGDKLLVANNKTLVQVAERNMKDIVPLYYEMKVAKQELITPENIFSGLDTAHSKSNIGQISNTITKVWNSNKFDLNDIKILCMENNFTIDYGKTLYKPERPKSIKKQFKSYNKMSAPHFFIYAKNKLEEKVETANNSVVNQLINLVPNPKMNFYPAKKQLGKLDYTILMSGIPLLEGGIDKRIIDTYNKENRNKRFNIRTKEDEKATTNDNLPIFQYIRGQLLDICSDPYYVTDVLVKYLFEKDSEYKLTLWSCFGEYIVDNMKRNLTDNPNYRQCKNCCVRIENKQKKMYCEPCAEEIRAINVAEAKKKYIIKNNKKGI